MATFPHKHGKIVHTHTHAQEPHGHFARCVCNEPACAEFDTHNIHPNSWKAGQYGDSDIAVQITSLWRWLTGVATGYEWFDILIRSQYSTSDRKYHDLNHVTEMVAYLYEQTYTSEHAFWETVYAALMHDIASPKDKNGVAVSCNVAIMTLQLIRTNYAKPGAGAFTRGMDGRVYHAIAATDLHVSQNPDTRHLIDADLARFCIGDFHRWADEIRHEYREHPDEKFNAGRKAVLEKFLARDPFYYSHDGGLSSAVARLNIVEQLAELENI